MTRAGTGAWTPRRWEDAGVLLLLMVMGACLALVLERLVAAPVLALPVPFAAVLSGWLLGAWRPRFGWLAISSLLGAAVAIWLSGVARLPGASPLDQLLAIRADLLAEPGRILDAASATGQAAGPLALLTLVWAMPLVAARACRLRRGVVPAWVPLGALLVAGMWVRRDDDLGPLIGFAAAALLLTVTVANGTRRRRWQRRSMTETDGVAGAIARRGWAATAVAVAAAWALTSVAVGAPLESVWRELGEQLEDAWSGAKVPGGGVFTAEFDADFEVSGVFQPSGALVARVSGVASPVYLRVVTHDTYTRTGWTQAEGPVRRVAQGEPLLADAALELPADLGRGQLAVVTVTLERDADHLLLPGQAVSLSVDAEVVRSPTGPFVVSAAAPDLRSRGSYGVLAVVRPASGADLAGAAPADAELLAPYLALDGVSARTQDEARRVVTGRASDYDRAVALLDYLRRSPFAYSTRAMRPPAGSGQDIVDFFLFDDAGRIGFCEQFASAMVVMARSVGIPARLARGYAGGRPLGGGRFQVTGANRHAWAELYFPGYGWQVFEATPAIARVIRPSGSRPMPTAGESAASSPSPSPSRRPERARGEEDGMGIGPGWVAAALAGGLGAAVLIAVAWRRRAAGPGGAPRRAFSPARSWARLGRVAARVGLAPQPSQTAFEFAAAMERALPQRGEDIRLLADAYVVEMYAPPAPPPSRAGELAQALRRVMDALRRARWARIVRGPRRR